jgi:vacuole morphology and inheritance protein 14
MGLVIHNSRLFNYLSDPNVDVRTATLNLLAEFLKEMNLIVMSSQQKVDDISPHDSASMILQSTASRDIPLDFGKMTG